MRTDAEIYVELACAVVTHCFATEATVDDVRAWWIDEAERRLLYELNQDQIDTILDACREVAMKIPEREAPKPPRRKFGRKATL